MYKKNLLIFILFFSHCIFGMDAPQPAAATKQDLINRLHTDLLREIFFRVPDDWCSSIDWLRPFVIVCKRWRAVIDEKEFTKKIIQPLPGEGAADFRCKLNKATLPCPLPEIVREIVREDKSKFVLNDAILITIERACYLNSPSARDVCFALKTQYPFIAGDLLLRASEEGSVHIVEKLLLDGLDHDSIRCKYGRTALRHAVSRGKWRVVRKILELAPSININEKERGGDCLTVLGEAASYCQDKCIRELLAHPKIDTEIRSKKGQTASAIVFKKSPSTAEMIDRYGTEGFEEDYPLPEISFKPKERKKKGFHGFGGCH